MRWDKEMKMSKKLYIMTIKTMGDSGNFTLPIVYDSESKDGLIADTPSAGDEIKRIMRRNIREGKTGAQILISFHIY